MKLFLDFFPLVLFFLVFKAFDIYVSPAITLLAPVRQLALLASKLGPVEPQAWVRLGGFGSP